MPEWSERAIILSARPHGENNAVISLFTPSKGRHAGLVYAASSRTKRGILEAGNHVQASWRARLDEQLGVFSLELEKSPSAFVLDNPVRLSALASMCVLIDQTLPERVPHEQLYHASMALLDVISLSEEEKDWLPYYVRWELALLSQLGFGLALDKCAVTGEDEGLVFVSPRSGHAVTRQGAGKFADRMLALPSFLLNQDTASRANNALARQDAQHTASFSDGLALTGHFLANRIFALMDKPLPSARLRLSDLVSKFCQDT